MNEKIEQFWRDADGADVMRVMDGQTVEARFRDSEDKKWVCDILSGWERPGVFIDGEFKGHLKCQVYDPPEWFVNKPDPGEGYRLLEKFPPEELQEGDEAWGNYQDNEWGKSDYAESGCRHQPKKVWYRRRIANNPVTPDSSNYSEIPNSCEVVAYEATEGELIELPSGKRIRITAKGFEVA